MRINVGLTIAMFLLSRTAGAAFGGSDEAASMEILESEAVDKSDSGSGILFRAPDGATRVHIGELSPVSNQIPGIICKLGGINELRISTANSLLSIRLDWASAFYVAVQRSLKLRYRPVDGHNNGFFIERIQLEETSCSAPNPDYECKIHSAQEVEFPADSVFGSDRLEIKAMSLSSDNDQTIFTFTFKHDEKVATRSLSYPNSECHSL